MGIKLAQRVIQQFDVRPFKVYKTLIITVGKAPVYRALSLIDEKT